MSEENTGVTDTAIIKISPGRDDVVLALMGEGRKLKEFAVCRTIAKDEDLKPATDDLSLIAKLKKALNEKKAEYVKPIKAHLDAVNSVFAGVLSPLEEADIITRQKITAYRVALEKARLEAEAINQAKIDLARREEALTGEHTVDLTPMQAPEQIKKVATNMGTVSMAKNVTWELVDFALVPDQYKVLDSGKITKLVKGGGTIPGIKVNIGETLRVTTK